MSVSSVSRRVLTHYLEDVLAGREDYLEGYRNADRIIDESLDTLDYEEPSLSDWVLNDHDIGLVYQGITWAIRYGLSDVDPRTVRNIEALMAILFKVGVVRTAKYLQSENEIILPPVLDHEPSAPSVEEIKMWLQAESLSED